jgi:hypothetical protein
MGAKTKRFIDAGEHAGCSAHDYGRNLERKMDRRWNGMTGRSTVAVIVAGLAVAALGVAPAAQARRVCEEVGNQTTCQTNGSISIKSRPGTIATPANQPHITWNIGRRR